MFALTIVRDVTEITRIQKRLESIYDTVGDVIFLVALEDDGGFRFESVNKRFAMATGLPTEAVVDERVEEVIPPASLPLVLDRFRETIERKGLVRWEQTIDFPAGRRTGEVSVAPIFDQSGRCTHLVGAVHDITERQAAEEREAHTETMLRQSQKLEGIGHLAGGVAHDFNNILGVILGYGELMRHQIAEGHPARPRLDLVIQAAQRAAGLTRQLLAFSRKQVMQPKLLDLGVMVGELRRMLERVVGEDLEIVVESAEGLGAVLADPTQIEQVIMNLVVNARDAMPRGGFLTLETANVDFDHAYASTHPPAQAGSFVMLAVSDTGVGMDAETQRRMFEPFFTTKPQGEGTGLGLATVYGIVKQMGGYVWVYSEVGRGTTFKIYLPRVAEAATSAPAPVAATPLPGGHETVLVVEDTESLRDLVRELLEDQGYTVLCANDGEEALALAGNRGVAIDLLLTDVVMPKLSGGDLVRQLRVLRPEIRVLYMSGYTEGAVTRQGVPSDAGSLLEKPFTGQQLATAVRRVLDRARNPLT
jgi:PAS domain S-box-containing protein